jgi:hypothetical protein
MFGIGAAPVFKPASKRIEERKGIRMPSWKWVIVLFVSVFLLMACSGTADIELGQNQTDLGIVENGELQTFEVPVRNVGSADLVIEAVTTSCGCTTAVVSPMTIPAGEEGLLTVEYDSGAHGPEFSGPVERQIFVASNDPDEPELRFTLLVEVVLP